LKTIALFGAGKSATVLIEFLEERCATLGWQLIIVDAHKESILQKIKDVNQVQAIGIDIANDAKSRANVVAQADAVISLMPPHLHIKIAEDCLRHNKDLFTASYIDEAVKKHAAEIERKGLLFLYELGLDPGIDHLSAMHLIDEIKAKGGNIKSFKSYCGGLVAAESDDNPWHYKISWNPRNIILAGKAGANLKVADEVVSVAYENLFEQQTSTTLINGETWAYYYNRDSNSYIDLYDLQNAATFFRATFRHPDFMEGWQHIVNLGLTSEAKTFSFNGENFTLLWKLILDEVELEYYLQTFFNLTPQQASECYQWLFTQSTDISTPNPQLDVFLKQMKYLGTASSNVPSIGAEYTFASLLQCALENFLKLKPTDKDLILMLHEIEYKLNDKTFLHKSELEVKGSDNLRTAMAKTVGLPLGIAVVAHLQKKFALKGLLAPVHPELYSVLLPELAKMGVSFKDQCMEI
jgi:saccharopine dehydrogenase-like NADP-dependent oxidoreductase